MHAVLRNALQNAMREDLLTRNVAALVRAPQPAAREFTPWSVDEAVTLLGASAGHPLHAAFVLVITLGLRHGEVRRLGGQRPRIHYEARDADRAPEHGPRLRPALREGRPAQDPPARHETHVGLAAGGRRSPPENGHVDPGTQPDRGDQNVYTHVTTEDNQRTAVGLLGGLLDLVPGHEEVGRSRQTQPSARDLEHLGGAEE